MNKKRILMIIPQLGGGGAERVVSNLSLCLKDKYEIDILLDYNNITYPYTGKVFLINSDKKKVSGILNELMTYVRKMVILRKMKKRNEYDCYISHSDISHVLNLVTGGKGCKVILALHHRALSVHKSRISQILNCFAKCCYKKADGLIAVSEGVRQEYIRNFDIPPEKIAGIWNGTDISHIQDKKEDILSEKQERWFKNGKTIATMGRFCIEKGQQHLLYSFQEVLKSLPECKLLLLGEGELEEELRKTAKNLKIEDKVIFCGFQKNPFSIIAKSDLFIFCSIEEGFGYALEEAICCDVPCISSDFQFGAREILRYNKEYTEEWTLREAVYTDYGVLVPVCKKKNKNRDDRDRLTREEKAMANAIVKTLKDADYRKKVVEKNRERLQEFSLERMGECWSKVIDEA